MRRARRNPAALGSLLDRLALGKRGAVGQPTLLVVQPGQRRARERAERLPALLAPETAQAARLAPRHSPASVAMRTAPLVIHAQFNRRQRGRALRRVREHRRHFLALRRRQLIDAREPVPKPLVIHLSAKANRKDFITMPTIHELSPTRSLLRPEKLFRARFSRVSPRSFPIRPGTRLPVQRTKIERHARRYRRRRRPDPVVALDCQVRAEILVANRHALDDIASEKSLPAFRAGALGAAAAAPAQPSTALPNRYADSAIPARTPPVTARFLNRIPPVRKHLAGARGRPAPEAGRTALHRTPPVTAELPAFG